MCVCGNVVGIRIFGGGGGMLELYHFDYGTLDQNRFYSRVGIVVLRMDFFKEIMNHFSMNIISHVVTVTVTVSITMIP